MMNMGYGLRHTPTRRILASLVGGVFALVLASRGLCVMSPGPDAPTDPHACCRTGLQPAAPACCLDAPSADTPARETPAPAAIAPSSAFVADLTPLPAERRAAAVPEASPPGHSPPDAFSILRI